MKLVVTRHPAYVQYLVDNNIVEEGTEVIGHATIEEITGREVITSGLPLHMAAVCKSVTSVGLFLPAERRGQELSLEDVRKYAQPAATYSVTRHSADAL